MVRLVAKWGVIAALLAYATIAPFPTIDTRPDATVTVCRVEGGRAHRLAFPMRTPADYFRMAEEELHRPDDVIPPFAIHDNEGASRYSHRGQHWSGRLPC